MKLQVSWFFLAFFGVASILGQGQPTQFMPLDSVKPGMKGIGQTTFEGTQIEPFDVEILGVLRNFGPQQNLILARLSGERVDRSGVFAGMSGSPVYINERLVGAVSYSFPFSREAIAGITPIEEMIDIFEENVPTSFRLATQLTPRKLYTAVTLPDLSSLWQPPSVLIDSFGQSGTLQPIATPLSLSGFLPRAVASFDSRLRAMGMVSALGAGAAAAGDFPDTPLAPGSTISVQLVRGDMDVNASGTVTHIDGDMIYAFGHPFLSIGYTDLPLNKAAVLTVIPSFMNGQKLSATTSFVGSIRQDRATGIMGVRGVEPKMIPIHLKLHTSRNEIRDFQYEVVTDNFLTPFLMTFTVHNSIVSSERAIGSQTLQVKARISIKGQNAVRFENSISDPSSSPAIAAVTAASPVNFLLNSGFDDLIMERIDLEIHAVEQDRQVRLEKVWQDKLEVKAGEEVELTVFLRKANGEMLVEKHPVFIPADIQPGPLDIMIGDGISLTRAEAEEEPGEFTPQNLEQLVRAINNLKKNDRLYIRLFRNRQGAIIGGEGLPDLPPSFLSLYNSGKTSGDVKPINRVVYGEYELQATEFVLTGQQTIQVRVTG